MREKVTLLVAVLVGLLAFGVACSPALSDQPVADPHGTPEQQWTWWRVGWRRRLEKHPLVPWVDADAVGWHEWCRPSEHLLVRDRLSSCCANVFADGVTIV